MVPTICGFDGIRDCILETSNSSPVAQNIRRGDWLIDYLCERMVKTGTEMKSFRHVLQSIKATIPNSYKPLAMYHLFKTLDSAIDIVLCQKFGWKYDETRAKLLRAGLLLVGFKKDLANVDVDKWLAESFRSKIMHMSESLGANSISSDSVSELSQITSASKQTIKLIWNDQGKRNKNPLEILNISLAAGVPHFFTGMFRSWGRDQCLSVTGLLTL